MPEHSVVPVERVERAILLIRGHRVLVDEDLAALYGVQTKRLNEQVKRNMRRFPIDFTFQLTAEEARNLRSQTATSRSWGGARTRPRVFTEHGAIMAASVLNSPRAIEMSILVVRAFVKFRTMLATHGELGARLAELERRLATHDEQIVALFRAIRELMQPPTQTTRRIGFSRR